MLRETIIAGAVLIAGGALAQEPAGDRIEVNGIETYYEVSGEGEPIVVLHGAHMNIDTMGGIIPKLAESRQVYALEFQGHGRSTDIDRPITYENLADDVAAFMDEVGLEKADIFGYSMGAAAALQLGIRHPDKVDQLVLASVSYDEAGWHPDYKAFIPQMSPAMFEPFRQQWEALAPDPKDFDAFIEKMIALEHEPMHWEADVKALEAPALIITGDADVTTLEHSVAMFKLLGGGAMGDMGKPLSDARLAILPATSHTAIITQVDVLMSFVEPFLKGERPKGFFE